MSEEARVLIRESIPGEDRKQTFLALEDLPATVGRSSRAKVTCCLKSDGSQIPEEIGIRVSAIHATVFSKDGCFWVKDGAKKPSTNGLWVLGRRRYDPIKLHPGREVVLYQSLTSEYSLSIEMPLPKLEGDGMEYDTLEVNELVVELHRKDTTIEALQQESRSQQWQIDELKNICQGLEFRGKAAIEEIRGVNVRQNKLIQRQNKALSKYKRLLLFIGIITLLNIGFALGWDPGKLEGVLGTIGEIVKYVSLGVNLIGFAVILPGKD